MKKKIKSTVLCVAFHPKNGQVLATGAADFKCRIFSTYSADVDGSGVDDVHSYPFAKPVEFGECYAELSCNSWVNALAWSPSGDVLCYATHDSCIHFASGFGTYYVPSMAGYGAVSCVSCAVCLTSCVPWALTSPLSLLLSNARKHIKALRHP